MSVRDDLQRTLRLRLRDLQRLEPVDRESLQGQLASMLRIRRRRGYYEIGAGLASIALAVTMVVIAASGALRADVAAFLGLVLATLGVYLAGGGRVLAMNVPVEHFWPHAELLPLTERERVVRAAAEHPPAAAVVRSWLESDRDFCAQERRAVFLYCDAAERAARYDDAHALLPPAA